MPRKQPVEKPRARPTDVQITGRRWGKTNADVRHWSDPVMVTTDRRPVHSLRRAQRSRPTNSEITSLSTTLSKCFLRGDRHGGLAGDSLWRWRRRDRQESARSRSRRSQSRKFFALVAISELHAVEARLAAPEAARPRTGHRSNPEAAFRSNVLLRRR